MNKAELVKKVSEQVGMTQKNTMEVVEAVFDTIAEEMAAGEEVAIFGFGKFTTVEKSERTARNPKTNEEVIVPAHKSPKFKPASALKEAVA